MTENSEMYQTKIFTFHYVSITSGLCILHVLNLRYLHSTMFLLHQNSLNMLYSNQFNLHSTMFLLHPGWHRGYGCDWCDIYIPLCFYYIGRTALLWSCLMKIYIPLCFYYIKLSRGTLWLFLQHLHSTMFLLHLNLYTSNVSLNIQFTFHYVSITSFTINPCIYVVYCIYIPLCFYYIPFTMIFFVL